MQSTKCRNCHSANTYSPDDSWSYLSLGTSKELAYGKGYAKGVLSSESINIGGKQIKNQNFVLVDYEEDFEGMDADGILGMGFPELSDMDPPLVLTMFDQGFISSPLFSVYLSNNDFGNEEEEMESTVIFGGSDLKKYSKGDVDYINLVSTGYWSVDLTKIIVNGEKVNLQSKIAILDTGTSLLIGPDREVQEILGKISKGKNCYTSTGILVCPCTSKDEFESIEFWLAGKKFVVMSEEYILKSEDQCIILMSSMNFNAWILGDAFLRSYYTIYDMGEARVGIARSSSASEIRDKNNVLFIAILYFLGIACVLGIAFFARVQCLKWRNRQAFRNQNTVPRGYVSMTEFN